MEFKIQAQLFFISDAAEAQCPKTEITTIMAT